MMYVASDYLISYVRYETYAIITEHNIKLTLAIAELLFGFTCQMHGYFEDSRRQDLAMLCGSFTWNIHTSSRSPLPLFVKYKVRQIPDTLYVTCIV